MHKVAVITRTKDRPIFLERAVGSVSRQSFGNYVHVIVNDGGKKQGIDDALGKFGSDVRAKIKVFHRGTSSDAPDTIFNESIDRVDSEYFAIHDDDDTWHEDFLKRTVEHLDDNKRLGAVVVRAERIEEELQDNGTIKQLKSLHWMPDLKVINLYRQCIDNQFTPIATLFRRSAYQKAGKFDDDLPVVGDWEFGVRLLSQFDADYIDPGYPLANYHHRAHKPGVEGNTSFGANDKHRYYTNYVMNKHLRKELAEGRLGAGYIMSKLKYDQGYTARLAKSVLPSFVVNRLKKRV